MTRRAVSACPYPEGAAAGNTVDADTYFPGGMGQGLMDSAPHVITCSLNPSSLS